MPSVGAKLREARAKQGCTLEQISAQTRIPLKNLNAIEADDLSQLSSPFLYRSFVRQFAEELSLEYGSMASEVQAASSSMPEPRVPGQGDVEAVRVAPIRSRIRLDFRWLYPATAFLLIVAACSSFNTIRLRFSPASAKASSAAVTGLTNGLTPAQAPPPVSPAAAQLSPPTRQHSRVAKPAAETKLASDIPSLPAESSIVPAAEGTPVALVAETAIHIELSAIEATWLSITADGKQTYSGILEAAETKILEGHETARIRTGNAGGVNVVFNGKPLGTLGRRGQTRTVLFTRSGYEVLEPSAVMELTRLSRNGE
jgi:cytoskeleton protein RodZ